MAIMHGPTERPKQRFDHLERIPENKTSNLQYHSKPNCRKAYKEEISTL